VKALLRREADDWPFVMGNDNRVITLIEQFEKVLEQATNIRSIACVISMLWGIGVFDVARNMGTSVQVNQNYYGKHGTPTKLATQLGG